MILATGETGFSGSKFILQCCAQVREGALDLDASTSVKNFFNLQVLKDEPIKFYEKLITYVPDRTAHDWHYTNDARKIEHELRKSADTFETSMCKTVQWYLNNRDSVAQQYGSSKQ
jgi:dTDP-D-glucose 4,6-dehydratase